MKSVGSASNVCSRATTARILRLAQCTSQDVSKGTDRWGLESKPVSRIWSVRGLTALMRSLVYVSSWLKLVIAATEVVQAKMMGETEICVPRL